MKVIDDADADGHVDVVVVAVVVVYVVVAKRREEKRIEEKRRQEKRREEKRREGKKREWKGREQQEQKQEQKQEQETQAISSIDYTEEERRAHRTIAPKQTGEKHPSAKNRKETKRPTTLKMYKGSRTRTICARVKTWYKM